MNIGRDDRFISFVFGGIVMNVGAAMLARALGFTGEDAINFVIAIDLVCLGQIFLAQFYGPEGK